MTPNVVLSKLAKHQKLTTFFVTDLILIPVHLKEVRKIKIKVLKIRRITKKKKSYVWQRRKKRIKTNKEIFYKFGNCFFPGHHGNRYNKVFKDLTKFSSKSFLSISNTIKYRSRKLLRSKPGLKKKKKEKEEQVGT